MGFKGPRYEKVCTSLLAEEVKHVEDSLKPIEDSWIEKRVSILSNGWKDAKNCPLINVVVVSPKGQCFLEQWIVKDR